ncbi:MAG: response regulator, partial [Anaerolineae bacterium]|nr:response regulator [Anaerolineae bacterium]
MPGQKILIIDDETLIRTALAEYLQDVGFEMTCAADGQSGLELCHATRYDAVLVDLRMPGMDGLQVIRTLRSEHPDTPVIVISGTGLMEDVISAMREGAWDYIQKPVFDMDQIKVVIDRVLEKSQLMLERKHYQLEIEKLNTSLAAEVERQTAD